MIRSLASRWLPVAALMAAIFYLSSQDTIPGGPTYVADTLIKKSAHFLGYGLMMWLLLRALRAGHTPTRRTFTTALVILAAYAASDEFHQTFVPGRTGQVVDVLIDFTGGLVAGVSWHIIGGGDVARLRYWLVFGLAAQVLWLLNLPWQGLPAQDMGWIVRDPWLLWGFNWFGLLMVAIAALMIEDALGRRQARLTWLVLPYFGVGILALAPFLALRKRAEEAAPIAPRWTSMLERRWLWAAWPLAAIALSVWLLPSGNWANFSAATSQSLGFSFMWLDIALNQIFALPLLQADMQRRSATAHARMWIVATAISGPIGLGAYLATRPGGARPA